MLIVYFKLYDYDDDDKISPNDISSLLRILNENDDDASIKNKDDKKKKNVSNTHRIGNIHEKLLNGIFNELVTNSKLPYITFPIFKDLLMETNIHQTCVMSFDSEDED